MCLDFASGRWQPAVDRPSCHRVDRDVMYVKHVNRVGRQLNAEEVVRSLRYLTLQSVAGMIE